MRVPSTPGRRTTETVGSNASTSPTSASSHASANLDSYRPPSSPPTITALKNDASLSAKSKINLCKMNPVRDVRICRPRVKIGCVFAILCCAAVLFCAQPGQRFARLLAQGDLRLWEILSPATLPHAKDSPNPDMWLRENSVFDYEKLVKAAKQRPKAAMISLVRNEELEGILQSMRQLEYYFNRRHNYSWIFFSEVAFSEEFMAATSNATSGRTEYHLIPLEHWSTPPNISRSAFYDSLDYLGALGVGKGSLLSYRHMCRWNSLFFFHHPALASYTHYWRVEPDVHFFCHIPYDPFAFLASNNLIYGFNMAILEDARSFPSLWRTTLSFIAQHPDLLHPDADLSWIIDRTQGNTYNNCQFFSNFEIGDLRFFRSQPVQVYLRYLDESGGFFYERFGDAPIHTLAVSLFAAREQVWFFRDIGYQHDSTRHCPADWLDGAPLHGGRGRNGGRRGKMCMWADGAGSEFLFAGADGEPAAEAERYVYQVLAGWGVVEEEEGWKRDVEVALGGDGYGGYVRG